MPTADEFFGPFGTEEKRKTKRIVRSAYRMDPADPKELYRRRIRRTFRKTARRPAMKFAKEYAEKKRLG